MSITSLEILTKIEEVEKNGYNINDLVIDNNTKEPILLYACIQNYIDVARVLLEKQYNMNMTNILGESLAHLIIKYQRIEWIRLFEKYIDFQKVTDCNETVFHYAASIGNNNVIEFLFSLNYPVQFIEKKDNSDRSALDYAIYFDNHQFVKYLFQYLKKHHEQNPLYIHDLLQNGILPAIIKANAIDCMKLLKEILTPNEWSTIVEMNVGNLAKAANENGFFELSKEILCLCSKSVSEFMISVLKQPPLLFREMVEGFKCNTTVESVSLEHSQKKRKI